MSEEWRTGTEGRWRGTGDYECSWLEYESKGRNGQYYKRYEENVYEAAERLTRLESQLSASQEEVKTLTRKLERAEKALFEIELYARTRMSNAADMKAILESLNSLKAGA